MAGQDHLTLRLTYLKSPGEWSPSLDGFGLLFPKEGRGQYAIGRMVQALAPGDVVVLEPGKAGKLRVMSGHGGIAFGSFSICLEHLFPLFATEEISLLDKLTENLKGVRHFPATSPLAQACHRLLAEVSPESTLDHRSQLLRVAALILSEEFKRARGQRVGFMHAEEHLSQVLETLSAQDLLGLSVGELARKFGCSRRHLNRMFHEHFGVSMASLRMDMRMFKAVSLLRNPDAKVINVAEQCGFNHLGLFNICFKRRFGVSPGHWRKRASLEDGAAAIARRASANCPMNSNGLCPWGEKDRTPGAPKPLHFVMPASALRLPARHAQLGSLAALARAREAEISRLNAAD